MIEENEENRKVMVRMLEENEDNRKIIESIPVGSDVEVEQALQNYRTAGREVLGWDQGQADLMECGLRLAVEARRKGRRQQGEEQRRQGEQGQHPGQEQSKQDKQVNLGDEEQARAKSTDEPEVMGRLAEVRTGRGSSGLVRGGDERCRADETRKGKGKGNGGKGEHEGKGGLGSKERQQVENSVTDEDQGNTGVMRSEEEEENHREDVRKLVEMMQKDQEGQRGRVAPNMGAGGSHPQAMSVPERRETQGMRWADCQDCQDDEGKEEEEEEQETEKGRQEEAAGKKEQEQEQEQEQEEGEGGEGEGETEGEEERERKKEKETRQETGQREEERRAQEAPKERRTREAREEQERAQKALK